MCLSENKIIDIGLRFLHRIHGARLFFHIYTFIVIQPKLKSLFGYQHLVFKAICFSLNCVNDKLPKFTLNLKTILTLLIYSLYMAYRDCRFNNKWPFIKIVAVPESQWEPLKLYLINIVEDIHVF